MSAWPGAGHGCDGSAADSTPLCRMSSTNPQHTSPLPASSKGTNATASPKRIRSAHSTAAGKHGLDGWQNAGRPVGVGVKAAATVAGMPILWHQQAWLRRGWQGRDAWRAGAASPGAGVQCTPKQWLCLECAFLQVTKPCPGLAAWGPLSTATALLALGPGATWAPRRLLPRWLCWPQHRHTSTPGACARPSACTKSSLRPLFRVLLTGEKGEN